MSVLISACFVVVAIVILLRREQQRQQKLAAQRQRIQQRAEQRQAKQQQLRKAQDKSRRGGEALRSLEAQRRRERLASKRQAIKQQSAPVLGIDGKWGKLHGLTHCNRTSERLVSSIMRAHAGKSPAWAIEKAISDIERDRQTS